MYPQDRAARQPLRLLCSWRLEWLRVIGEPDPRDTIASYTLVHAASDRLHFGQFRHRLIVEDRDSATASSDLTGFLAEILGQLGFFVRLARLHTAPFLQVHSAQREPEHKDTH